MIRLIISDRHSTVSGQKLRKKFTDSLTFLLYRKSTELLTCPMRFGGSQYVAAITLELQNLAEQDGENVAQGQGSVNL